MKKTILLVTLLLLTQQALALDEGSVDITVTINKGPDISKFKPADGYTITEADTLKIEVEASDPNKDTLQYRFYVNGKVKKPWATDSSYSYKLTEDDIGLNKIKAEVTDGMETVFTPEVEIYVFRKGPGLPS